MHARQPFDACIVLRGGGSQLDLDWLNSLAVARAITRASLPVFTAIGHERDRVALDEVSHCSFDTPSKAIAHIRTTVRDRAVAAARDLMRIEKAVGRLNFLYPHRPARFMPTRGCPAPRPSGWRPAMTSPSTAASGTSPPARPRCVLST